MLIFDDVGSQPALELLRQVLTLHGVFDLKRQTFASLPQADFIAVTTDAGGPGQQMNCYSLHMFSIT